MAEPARNAHGLPSIFGYEELERIYTWKRRTLENAVARGLLRKPFYVGKKAFWYGSDIDSYLARLRGELETLAVTAPDEIPAAQIEPAMSLLAERWAKQHGIEVQPGAHVSLSVPLTDAQKAAVQRTAAEEQAKSVGTLTDAFGRLDIDRACLVAGGLMPVLRSVTDRILQNKNGIENNVPQDELRALALDILEQAVEGKFAGPNAAVHMRGET
jgi:predicted RNA-binding protein with PUA-like domain